MGIGSRMRPRTRAGPSLKIAIASSFVLSLAPCRHGILSTALRMNWLSSIQPHKSFMAASLSEDYASREGVSASGPDFEQLMGRSPQRRELWLRGLSICLTRRVAHLYSPCAKVTEVHLEKK